jgi:hypothetical protein
MRRTLSLLLALLASQMLFAQSEPQPADDMPFGLIMGIILLSVALACMAAGVIISIVALSITAAMAAAGIISTAIVVGLYKRSVTAGFKTLLMLACALGGAITGATGLYLANKIFNFNLARVTVAWSGLAGGLIGGILLALVIISIIRFVIGLFKERLSL